MKKHGVVYTMFTSFNCSFKQPDRATVENELKNIEGRTSHTNWCSYLYLSGKKKVGERCTGVHVGWVVQALLLISWRRLIILGEDGLTERRVGLVDDSLPMYLDIWEHNIADAPNMRPNFFDKQLSHRGRLIPEGVSVQRRNMAEFFELDLYSFADFSEKVPRFPCGHHIAGLPLRLGVVRTGLSKKISVFPMAGLGQLAGHQTRHTLNRVETPHQVFSPEGWSPLLFPMIPSEE